jgi:hypothetical protein
VETPSWRTRLENAKLHGYLTAFPHEDRARKAWYEHCRANRLPFVHVQPSRRKADITLWMAHTGRKLTQEEQNRARTFDFSGGKALEVSNSTIDIIDVPHADVNRVATFLRSLTA